MKPKKENQKNSTGNQEAQELQETGDAGIAAAAGGSGNMVIRFLVYLGGLFIMTLGIGISVKSNLGVSPVSSIPYTITCVWGIEMGKATMLFHAGLVIIQIILLRSRFRIKNLLQIPVGVLFGYFTTFANYLMTFLPDPPNIAVQLAMMLISTALIAVGIFFYVPADIIPLAGEGVMLAVADVTKIKFSTVKLAFDISMVIISLATCLLLLHALGSVGLGTVVAAVLVGVELKIVTRLFGEARDRKLHLGQTAAAKPAGRYVLADIMKRNVYVVSEEASLSDVLEIITEKGISGVPVVNRENVPVGFISDGDILRFLASEHPLYVNPSSLIEMDFDSRLEELMECKVRDIARKRVITVDADFTLSHICQILTENHIKKAPVMRDGRMVGIINASNITKYAFRKIEALKE